MEEFSIYRRTCPIGNDQKGYFITFRTFKQVILTEDSRDITFISIPFHNNKIHKSTGKMPVPPRG